MNKNPLSFCMIICSRRRPALVAQALDSIANLTIPEDVRFSVLLVENDSKPQYASIVADFKDRIDIHYETEAEPGLTYVRNHGLATAEKLGVDWIGSIDDDIVIPKDWLEHMVSSIYKYPDTQMFYGNWLRHKHPDEPKWHPKSHHLNKAPTGRKIRVASFNNIAAKADVFAQDGMALRFDHRFNFIGGEDADFTRTYLKKGGIIRSVHEALAEEYNTLDRACFSEQMYRAVSTEYFCVAVRHKHDPLIVAILWSLQRVYRGSVLGVINLVASILVAPFDKQLALMFYGTGRRFLARVRGVFRYYFGSDPEMYRDEDA